ncbi:hypothetical protein CAPTEDRAFT_208218 [Capitella teleta]|uniref:BTB domain-containing protein n=1 Tax=Capitella teleta TaxID=283909 RepID=R7UIK4_CAPTE|nr:hypothetical protein CAPTEDRAFT_208218 [Capitella teleta]|eukprot:ELU06015.1 hypothetical protein CAPTEDRAFT_208218 [Capitella teleta]
MRPSKDCPLKAFNFEASGHSASVLTGLNALREKDQLFDVTLVADGQSFGAHRVALAASSDYFRAMFTDAMLECKQTQIELNGVGALGLKHILDYAYTSKLTLTLGNIQDILRAASHLQLLPVFKHFHLFLCMWRPYGGSIFKMPYFSIDVLGS